MVDRACTALNSIDAAKVWSSRISLLKLQFTGFEIPVARRQAAQPEAEDSVTGDVIAAPGDKQASASPILEYCARRALCYTFGP